MGVRDKAAVSTIYSSGGGGGGLTRSKTRPCRSHEYCTIFLIKCSMIICIGIVKTL